MNPKYFGGLTGTKFRPEPLCTMGKEGFSQITKSSAQVHMLERPSPTSTLLLLLPSENLPVLTSLQRRAEPLWSWYGTVALRGCRLGLQPPRGAAPPLADMRPGSAPLAAPRSFASSLGFLRAHIQLIHSVDPALVPGLPSL